MNAMRTTTLLLVGLGLVSGAAPPRAEAQVFTVLPVQRDARVAGHERSAAFAAVRSARVLGPDAEFRPVGPLEADLPPEDRDLSLCLEVDCAARLARGAGLDLVIVVAVWPRETDNAGSVAVTLVDPDGTIHEADVEIGEAGVSQAATAALIAAVRERSLGGGVRLRVTSAPDGALVVIDGTEEGVTPFSGAFAPGDHRVEVRLGGHEEVRDVTLADDPVTVDVTLGGAETRADVAVAPAPAPRRPSLWNYVLGGALLAGGVAALIGGPIQAAARSGETTEGMGPSGAPGQEVYFGGTAIALTIVSAVLLVGGAGMLILQPLSTDGGDLAGATVGLRGRF